MNNFYQILRSALLVVLVASSTATYAGLFDDDVAREQIKQINKILEENTVKQNKIVLDLSNQIQQLKEENSKLQGQIEAGQYRQSNLEKRQQDLFLDLDQRVRQLEQKIGQLQKNQESLSSSINALGKNNEANKEVMAVSNVSNTTANTATSATASSISAESKKNSIDKPEVDKPGDNSNPVEIYEAALSYFKAEKYKDAAKNFENFIIKHEGHSLAANATLWLGYSYAAQKDCQRAINAYQKLISKWPNSTKAPDAMYSIAECQSTQAAKKTIEKLLTTYPNSNAANKAKQKH